MSYETWDCVWHPDIGPCLVVVRPDINGMVRVQAWEEGTRCAREYTVNAAELKRRRINSLFPDEPEPTNPEQEP